MIVHYQNIEECILKDLLIYASVEKKTRKINKKKKRKKKQMKNEEKEEDERI